jgi:hypothetical protein
VLNLGDLRLTFKLRRGDCFDKDVCKYISDYIENSRQNHIPETLCKLGKVDGSLTKMLEHRSLLRRSLVDQVLLL